MNGSYMMYERHKETQAVTHFKTAAWTLRNYQRKSISVPNAAIQQYEISRDALQIIGKSEDEIDTIERQHIGAQSQNGEVA